MEVIFRPAAEQELREAHDWYEARESGLGTEFVRSVDACVQMIRRQSEIFPVIYKRVRRGVLRRFPYSVLYFSLADRIIIVSIFHSSRDPKSWQRRV